ncbi:MAG TPA: PadR family transcriptional regulator [Candidatus Angelobacter sp.]|nr:PadR family transcriptional regulator [Candidatus Angelobacter sp.]
MRQPKPQEENFTVHDRLHSAPKGLLRYYILHKIAQKPIHGYEIIQDIDSKTEGAWRPGAGSLYPILKKLASEGLIKAEPEPSEEATRRVYHITPKGVESLAHAKEMFTNFQQRFGSLRRLFIELVDPENLATFFVDGSNRQFQIAQEMLESKQNRISLADMEYILKEYKLNLERQMNWANRMLNLPKQKQPPTARPKVVKAR